MAGAEDFVPVGYEACRRCGEFFVEGTRRTRRCASCDSQAAAEATELEVAYEVEGRTFVDRPTRGRPRRADRRDPDKRRAWNRARSRALQRLRRIHPETWEVVFAQEKELEGLDPGLDVRSPGSAAIERELQAT